MIIEDVPASVPVPAPAKKAPRPPRKPGFFCSHCKETFTCPKFYKIHLVRAVFGGKLRSLARANKWYANDEDSGQYVCTLCPARKKEPRTITSMTNHLGSYHDKVFDLMRSREAQRLRCALKVNNAREIRTNIAKEPPPITDVRVSSKLTE